MATKQSAWPVVDDRCPNCDGTGKDRYPLFEIQCSTCNGVGTKRVTEPSHRRCDACRTWLPATDLSLNGWCEPCEDRAKAEGNWCRRCKVPASVMHPCLGCTEYPLGFAPCAERFCLDSLRGVEHPRETPHLQRHGMLYPAKS